MPLSAWQTQRVKKLFGGVYVFTICLVACRATGLETLDWAQGPEQQAAQMFKKFIRLVCKHHLWVGAAADMTLVHGVKLCAAKYA